MPENYLLSNELNEDIISTKVDQILREQLNFQIKHSDKIRDLGYVPRQTNIHEFMEASLRLKRGETQKIKWQEVFFSRGDILKNYIGIDKVKEDDYHLSCMYGDRQLHDKGWLEKGKDIIISSGGENNGLYGFYDYITHNDSCLSQQYKDNAMITCASAGTIGSAFVQEVNFSACDSTLIFFPKPDVEVELLYYIAALIRLEAWRFRYGRQMTPLRITDCLELDLTYYDRDLIKAYRSELPYLFKKNF